MKRAREDEEKETRKEAKPDVLPPSLPGPSLSGVSAPVKTPSVPIATGATLVVAQPTTQEGKSIAPPRPPEASPPTTAPSGSSASVARPPGPAPAQSARHSAPGPVTSDSNSDGPAPVPVPTTTDVDGSLEHVKKTQYEHLSLKVEDALIYLDKVKRRFAQQPQQYQLFLDIIKEFKVNKLDIPGVMSKVQKLFMGHRNLVVGFNAFLPPGYRLAYCPNDPEATVALLPTSLPMPMPTSTSHSSDPSVPGSIVLPPVSTSGSRSPAPLPSSSSSTLPPPPPPPAFGSAPPVGRPIPSITPEQMAALKADTERGAGLVPKGLDFESAVRYVNGIRQRFFDTPEKYKIFLEILHAYQLYKLTVVEVYEKVSVLFGDHPDLLEGFHNFLPDKKIPQMARQRQEERRRSSLSPSKVDDEDFAYERRKKLFKRLSKTIDIDIAEDAKFMADPPEELDFIRKVRAILSANKPLWRDLLRVLYMYSLGIFSRSDVVQFLNTELAPFPSVRSGLEKLLPEAEKLSNQQDEGDDEDVSRRVSKKVHPHYYTIPLSEVASASKERLGPSYRALTAATRKIATCSARSQLGRSVLNDYWVSVPSGSEDFKQRRKSPYEEMLIKMEDDRFELDMLIETNRSTVALLKSIEESLSKLSEEDQLKYSFEEKMLSFHKDSIMRIYGDQEILKMLREVPEAAIPVIISRLEQKQQEWCSVRDDCNSQWKLMYDKKSHPKPHPHSADEELTTAVEEVEEDEELEAVADSVAAAQAQAQQHRTRGPSPTVKRPNSTTATTTTKSNATNPNRRNTPPPPSDHQPSSTLPPSSEPARAPSPSHAAPASSSSSSSSSAPSLPSKTWPSAPPVSGP